MIMYDMQSGNNTIQIQLLYIFKGLPYMYITINYNMYTVCIRNTARSKSLPLICTHVYSYMFSIPHDFASLVPQFEFLSNIGRNVIQEESTICLSRKALQMFLTFLYKKHMVSKTISGRPYLNHVYYIKKIYIYISSITILDSTSNQDTYLGTNKK